ncbi:MAG: ribbon-helix-helix protein, CopG family [Methylovirgula sp.]
MTLSRNFGLSRRQAYRYLEEAQLDGPLSAAAEASVTITLKMPAGLARDPRVHAMHSGMTTSEIVRRAIAVFLSATHEHG